MNTLILSTFALLLPLGYLSLAEEEEGRESHYADMASVVFLNRDISRTSAFFADQIISPNCAKGVLGEAYAHRAYTKSHPQAVVLTPRIGLKGLDHVFIETNSKTGRVTVVVGESKTNTSRLGKTADGEQLGPLWTCVRLIKLGKRYQACGDPRKVVATNKRMPLNSRSCVDVPLPDGRHVQFFETYDQNGRFFSGTRKELELACQTAKKYGNILSGSAAGSIPTCRLLFHTDTNKQVLNIYNLSADGKSMVGSIGLKDLRHASAPSDFLENLAQALHNANPRMSDQAARTQASILAKERSLWDFSVGKTGSVALKSAKFSAISLMLEGGAPVYHREN